ncbi:MAG: TGS domain-containing protein [Ignisphaera sp.]|nr:TGS domain-containing protein [Ignisphaera sp.]MCX8168156.1 TGS domain-containing protein [Ignisphaera sp.]MDW8085204.1 TGS domain-containing protein [Ignisphaera sp.]
MVTNLPAEAKAKFAKYMEAKTPEEKLRALQEFLAAVPKHKGTENLVRWIRKRMSELREEVEERGKKKSGSGTSIFIEKEGAAQIAIIGFTKVGKSALLKALTGVNVTVSDIPYTTKIPVVGMLNYEDIQFQLVEVPSIVPTGGTWNTRTISLARNCDGLAIVLDASRNFIGEFKEVNNFLAEHGIHTVKPRGYMEIERKHDGGIRIVNYGKLLCPESEVIKLMNSYRIYNAVIKVYGEAGLDEIEKAIYENIVYKPTIVILNKIDLLESQDFLDEFRRSLPNEIPLIATSALSGTGLGSVGYTLFQTLRVIRIYTKPPTGKPSLKPLILRKGATVLDVAKAIHREFVEKFSYARIWGPSAKYPGQKVGLDHIVEDKDTVEINIKR